MCNGVQVIRYHEACENSDVTLLVSMLVLIMIKVLVIK